MLQALRGISPPETPMKKKGGSLVKAGVSKEGSMTPPGLAPGGELQAPVVANTGETNQFSTSGPYPATHKGPGAEFSQITASR